VTRALRSTRAAPQRPQNAGRGSRGGLAGGERGERPTRRDPRRWRESGLARTPSVFERTEDYRASASRPVYNGPQPRSWGKPGRDAKSVVPGLRPGDRRARRRWPAAAGIFWRREPVTCETVTGVVIGRKHDLRVGGPPVGGPATPVEFCHSACEMGRSPKLGRIPPTGTGCC